MRFMLLVSLAGLLTGCYTYTPIESTALLPDAKVRARISAVEADRLREYLPNSDRLLEGVVIGTDTGSVVLQVPAMTRETTGGLQVLHQRVSISRAGILELESKQLNRARTGLVIGVLGTAAAVMIFDAVKGNPGKEGLPGEEPGPEFRGVQLLRIRR